MVEKGKRKRGRSATERKVQAILQNDETTRPQQQQQLSETVEEDRQGRRKVQLWQGCQGEARQPGQMVARTVQEPD